MKKRFENAEAWLLPLIHHYSYAVNWHRNFALMGMRVSNILFACAFLFSCNTNDKAGNASKQDSVRQDGTIVEDTSSLPADSARAFQRNTKPPEGIFQVMLPCTDCRGIEHTVAFYPDLSYRLEESRLGKQKQTAQKVGNWKAINDTITLYKDGLKQASYTWKGDTLILLEARTGRPYVMHKLNSAADIEVWKKKKEKGVAFFGVGNEPFWNVEVHQQEGITFHLAEWNKPKRFKAAQPVVAADSMLYNTSNDSASLKITVYNTFCNDGMSDNIYEQKVKVQYKGQTYSGCGLVFK